MPTFAQPYFLLLLLLLPVAGWWYWRNGRMREVALKFSDLRPWQATWKTLLMQALPYVRLFAFGLLIIALARPQDIFKKEEIKGEGIDIFLVMDVSNSMLAEDFSPNRLEVCKQVAEAFVEKRRYDRIGLTIFSGEAFTQCPITTDHRVVMEFLSQLRTDLFEEQGTAIGMGLSSAVNRLKDSDAESKVIVLLTDGDNNAGYIPPLTAAELAKKYNIKVYTIGVGTDGYAKMPFMQRANGELIYRNVRVEINEELLTEIADITGARYFRAVSEKVLAGVYESIDQLEKTEIEITTITRTAEAFYPFAGVALLLLLLEWLTHHLFIRRFP
ncbi:MAG: VWA domain-containing protein [Saprospirales bacterium]|nr:VWA domain-containing protein [Saprospirales bacterium]